LWTPTAGNGYIDGKNLYFTYFIPNEMDPTGLTIQHCCNTSGGYNTYYDTIQCCENATVVDKQTISVVNRSGGARTGLMGGHIDLVIPGLGLVGYYGVPDTGNGSGGIGMGLTGYINIGYIDFFYGKTRRPKYIIGPGVVYGGLTYPGQLSTICQITACPSQIEQMKAAAQSIKANPGSFLLAGNNCSTNACKILGAGGIMSGGISGIDNPQNLQDQLTTGYNAKCFTGFTQMGGDGTATVIPYGPAPDGTPPSGNDPGGSYNGGP
jgi:hypothetical protein